MRRLGVRKRFERSALFFWLASCAVLGSFWQCSSESSRVCVAGEDCFIPTDSCFASVDCDNSAPCLVSRCQDALCDYTLAERGTPCPGGTCQERECVVDARCATMCTPGCQNCKDGDPCADDQDCMSLNCGSGGTCQNATCRDAIKNGTETDVDCGGLKCGRCQAGARCSRRSDCQLNAYCNDNFRCETLVPDDCGNGTIELGEACDPTADANCTIYCLVAHPRDCAGNSACQSDSCLSGSCTAPTCNDGIRNRDESAVDCGGKTCAPCKTDFACQHNLDCVLKECARGLCVPESCQNNTLDSDESDVDCGGPCSVCHPGQACSIDSDCAGSCVRGTCEDEPAHCADGLLSGDEIGADCGGSCHKTCIHYDCAAQNEIPVAECEKLKDLFHAANGPDWIDVTGWFEDANPCAWSGIACTSVPGNLMQVEVDETNLHGVIARDLDVLVELTRLTLTWGKNAPWLEPLLLHGAIPAEIGNLQKLQYLNLQRNQLSGAIPGTLGQLSELIGLSLYFNALIGDIPPELGLLSKLRFLHLQGNALTGGIPTTISDLTALETLQLHNNMLTGSLPSELGLLTKLRNLQVSTNMIGGPIPVALSNLTNLRLLDLNSNQFSGNLPPDLGQMTALANLFLSSNQLSNTIPPELGQLTQLRKLWLSNNNFLGEPPQELAQLVELTQILLSGNDFSGPFPDFLTTLTALADISIGANQFAGTIPDAIGELAQLERFIAHQNQFSGSVPAPITSLSALKEVRLCPQTGGLTANDATGSWLRQVTKTNWPTNNSC